MVCGVGMATRGMRKVPPDMIEFGRGQVNVRMTGLTWYRDFDFSERGLSKVARFDNVTLLETD